MDDSDSCAGSSPHSTKFTFSSGASVLMSSSGDDRSTAGSRSSIVSIPLSEVASSPVPASLSTAPANRGVSTPPKQHYEQLKPWRDPQLTETSIRHFAVNHQQLPPNCVAASIHHPSSYQHLSLLPSGITVGDQWRQQSLHKPKDYSNEKHFRERREIDLYEMERHKEMERERIERHQQQQQVSHASVAAAQHHQQQIQQHHHQQQQQQQQHQQHQQQQAQQQQQVQERERERREKEQCSNAEQAVSKHFEESLRRAKKQMRSAWTLNTLPPQHPNLQHLPPHLNMSSHVVQPQLPPHTSSTVSLPTIGIPPTVPQSQTTSSAGPVQQPPPKAPQSSQSSNIISVTDEQRRRMVECERLLVQRDRERERQREREKDREMDRLRQQQHQQEQQQRSYYAVAAGLQRNTVNTGLEYEVPHRANMSGMSGSQSKIVEKPPPQLKPEQGAFSLYSYSAFAQGYSKDMKAKPELCLPTPPPLMSDSKPPGSVIVKHDTHKQGPMQVVHSTKASPHPSHYKTASPATPRSHVIYEYRGAVPIITANERYKPTNLPTTQSAQYIQQPVVQPQSLTHQQQQQQQQTKSIHYSGVSATNSQNKPKVSSPAPSHIYGQPGEAGITAGIPVCRSQETTVLSGTKSSSPSPFQSHVYGPPPPVIRPPTVPPPAHSSRTMYDSRMFPAPAVKQTMPLTMHGSSPPTAAAAPIPMSRSPGIMMKMIPPKNIAPGQIGSPSYQTQPLDLGVTDRNRDDNSSPKRKASTPIHLAGSQVSLDVKKKRTETTQCTSLLINMPSTPPPIAPSPLMNATTTIPVSCSPDPKKSRTEQDAVIALTTTQPITTSADQCGTPVLPASSPPTVPNLLSVNTNPIRTSSADGTVRPSSTNSSISPSGSPGLSIQSAPGTPAKFSEPEKSTSPAPKRTGGCSNSAPRHLKKAWLQRHTGEDFEDTTGVVGSGSCVKLPLTLSPSPGSSTSTEASTGSSLNQQRPAQSETPPAHSLHNTGSNTVKSGKTVSKPHPKKNALNRDSGHNTDSDVKEESSSTDQEQSQKNPPKRKSTKVKRRKGGTRKPLEEKKKKNPASESEKESESDKESMSDKDSDSGTSGTSASTGKKNGTANLSSNLKDAKEPRKRGRRPKSNKDEPIKKRSRDETETKGPFRRPPVTQLKKTGESFLQDGPCFEVAPKLAKCRECRWTPNQRSKSTSNIFCRFYAFRRLRYTKNGQLAIAGFSDPHKDPSPDDIKLWMPDTESPPADLDMSMSRFLLAQVADQFCDLLQHEKEAIAEHLSDDKVVAWKRVVQGVREMCDVCETTLFNYHWACGKCGFVVCLDCYKDRKKKSPKIWGEVGRDRDDFSWLLCTNRSPHEQERLMLTQIIAGDSLQCLGKRIHEERSLWQIPQLCGCNLSKESPLKAANGACKELIRNLIKTECNGLKIDVKEDFELINGVDQIVKEEKEDKSALSWLADVALQNEGKKNGNSTNETRSNGEKDSNSDSSSESSDEGGQHSTLRELLIRSSNKSNGSSQPASPPNSKSLKAPKQSKMDALDVVLKSVQKKKVEEEDVDDITKSMQLKYYIGGDKQRKKYLPIRIMTLSESQVLYPDVPHTWLCDGKLLRLMDATHSGNVRIFQEQWKRGQPVLVSDVSKSLCMDLWRPESFTKDFGEDKNDLINCMNGNLVPNQPMKKFWDGFEYINKRLKDDKGQPMLLKLKDWPPGEDFAEILPTRFNDLMKALPLGDYTQRTGRLNLASRLPEAFVRPDLGPKMYNAYGSALHPTKGTTNLHLDISDAVNVMVYVGIPKDGQDEEYIKEAFRAIDEAGCDILTRRRVREKHELPGALWHIYAARDADKIRDLLNKVAIEKGARLEPNHDPIHDQSWYLDGVLRERLYKEYGVEGYPIAQCLGDAVFIPAGAPHQVRNLHNCIKVAEDFVSPENVSHCFHLTQEFRELSDSHSNHEDKLQIKNIIYHAVKDALACLSHVLGQKISESQRPPVEASGTNAPATAAARATDSPTSLETTETVADKQVKKESEDEV